MGPDQLVFVPLLCLAAIFGLIFWSAAEDLRLTKQFHHAYIGAALVVLGTTLGSEPLVYAGTAIIADDAWEHTYQRDSGNRSYQSPLHRLFALTIWRLPFVRTLAAWLDRLMGSPPPAGPSAAVVTP